MAKQVSKGSPFARPTTSAFFHSCPTQLHCLICTPAWEIQRHCRCPLMQPTHTLLLSLSTGRHMANSSSNKALRTLTSHWCSLLTAAVTPSTASTYKTGLRHYRNFCHGLCYPLLPSIRTSISLFAGYLHRLCLYPQTIQVYLASVAHFHHLHELSSPANANPLLTLTMRAIKRAHTSGRRTRDELLAPNHPRDPACPAPSGPLQQPPLLPQPADALSGLYAGFLCSSELTAPSHQRFDPRKHPTVADITFTTSGLKYHLQSKTDQLFTSVNINIGRTGYSLCPRKAMRRYLRHCHPSGRVPLFHFESGSPLTGHTFRRGLCDALHHLGYDASRYNTHSFRIGAATTAAEAGISADAIKTLGRWKSSAYQDYIRPTLAPTGPRTSLAN